MTDPDQGTGSPNTEPIHPADAMRAADAAATERLDADAKVTSRLDYEGPTERLDADVAATSRLDYDGPTERLSSVDTEAMPASAAFARARWAEGSERATEPPSPPPPAIGPVPRPPVGTGDAGAKPTPPPNSVPTAVPSPSAGAVGAGGPVQASPPTARTRPPMARATAPAPRRRRPRRRPRFATILWGVLLLGFAAFIVARTVLPAPPDPTFWLLGGVILVGLLLVLAGIAAAARRTG